MLVYIFYRRMSEWCYLFIIPLKSRNRGASTSRGYSAGTFGMSLLNNDEVFDWICLQWDFVMEELEVTERFSNNLRFMFTLLEHDLKCNNELKVTMIKIPWRAEMLIAWHRRILIVDFDLLMLPHNLLASCNTGPNEGSLWLYNMFVYKLQLLMYGNSIATKSLPSYYKPHRPELCDFPRLSQSAAPLMCPHNLTNHSRETCFAITESVIRCNRAFSGFRCISWVRYCSAWDSFPVSRHN